MLSNPSVPVANNNRDNAEANLICRVNDRLESPNYGFIILDLLGTGTFGQVFRCIKDDASKELCAVKVVKNKPAYYSQGQLEIKIASYLNTRDPNDERHIVRLVESFEFLGHVCLVFELLSMSLLDILTQNQFRGLPLTVVQRFTRQILSALVVLEDCKIIHCDLKVIIL
jgi:dual specificity protein kinase YAK1